MTHKEFLNKMHEMEIVQSDMCKEIHAELKELCGSTNIIVFDREIRVDFGDYKSFDAIAMCKGILMARCKNGWCDKPIQPYYANIWRFGWMQAYVERNEYHTEDNPIADHNYVVCV